MIRPLSFALLFGLLTCRPSRPDASPRTWVYQLQNADPAQLTATAFDVVEMDYARDGTDATAYTPEEIQTLRASGKLVLAYLSIGEAENYRFYWDPSWDTLPPPWLGPENPDWPGNFPVRYWDPAWQQLILAYLHRILQQGFDGVYLDRVDSYAFWADSLGTAEAAQRMIRWIQTLAESARAVHPGFWIIPQNGEEVLAYDTAGTLRQIVSGWAVEDLFFNETTPIPDSITQKRLTFLRSLPDSALRLSVDYVDDGSGLTGVNRERIRTYLNRARLAGLIPYAARTDRTLDRINILPGLQP